VGLVLLAYTTIVTISVLYVPQPLLPSIAAEVGVSRSQAALLTTAAFLPLAILPLIYGVLIESLSTRRVIQTALATLLVTSLALHWIDAFPVMIGLRLIQGAAVPAILTALMTQVSRTTAPERVQRVMSFYIAATIVGGFAGRFVSGLVASELGWRASFLLLAFGLAIGLAANLRVRRDVALRLSRPTLAGISATLRQRYFVTLYVVIFCVFLVFTAVLNFLPFRVKEIDPSVNELGIGLMYSGYLVGLILALASTRIARAAGDELRVVVFALLAYAVSVIGLLPPSLLWIFLNMLLFCGSMFLVHSLLSGLINRHAAEHKGVVNGLYVATYYGGGVIGSYVPGLVYVTHGWSAFLMVLLAAGAVAALAALSLRLRPA
jgi:YNFM family putative membrane transporter